MVLWIVRNIFSALMFSEVHCSISTGGENTETQTLELTLCFPFEKGKNDHTYLVRVFHRHCRAAPALYSSFPLFWGCLNKGSLSPGDGEGLCSVCPSSVRVCCATRQAGRSCRPLASLCWYPMHGQNIRAD